MNITVVGTGYVGLVTGTCFADMGNFVTCVDIDENKLAGLRRGVVPIHEPGLDEVIKRNVAANRLVFSSDLGSCLNDSDVAFIAVGTPPNEDGSADLSHVLAVASQIGELLEDYLVVVDKSTVPVGTADKVKSMIQGRLDARAISVKFDVVSNPEFLKEGAAVADFMTPDRIVVGAESEQARDVMKELYAPFARNHDKLQFMGIRDAEMTKYAANAMLATKISFMNEIALMCEKYDVDVENVRKGIGSDSRIGYSFIYPGAGYGGSCFPKDVRALVAMAQEQGVESMIFDAVEKRNNKQKSVILDKIDAKYPEGLKNISFAIWGLAFKPETDDVREASALVVIKGLIDRGATVKAFDPQAMGTTKQELGDISENLSYAEDMYSATENVHALILMTEWKQFRQPDFDLLAENLASRIIFDGRNVYDPETVSNHGLDYEGIGRRSRRKA